MLTVKILVDSMTKRIPIRIDKGIHIVNGIEVEDGSGKNFNVTLQDGRKIFVRVQA